MPLNAHPAPVTPPVQSVVTVQGAIDILPDAIVVMPFVNRLPICTWYVPFVDQLRSRHWNPALAVFEMFLEFCDAPVDPRLKSPLLQAIVPIASVVHVELHPS